MMQVALAQLNLTVGDIDGNAARIVDSIEWARQSGAQILALPELAVCGYPPEDLVYKRGFVDANKSALQEIASTTADLLTIIGFVDRDDSHLYNAAAICHDGQVKAIYHKQLLPNYGVFDEFRYFTSGNEHILIESDHGIIGVCVCEDAWTDPGPLISQGDAGAEIIVNINASPFHKGKLREREEMLGARARRAAASIVYVNMVGGQDELVFDGASLVISAEGEVLTRLPQFEEERVITSVPRGRPKDGHGPVKRLPLTLPESAARAGAVVAEPLGPEDEIYSALKLGLRDYARKNSFKKAVIGLSGGIDSSLTAAIAADALGRDAVLGVAMPSEFSSSSSVEDAKELAANLGIEMIEIPIGGPYQAYVGAMEAAFGPVEMGLAEENLQARIRGNTLMAISNRYGHLVLATGNKSEMACGYATLYGDMAGGLAVLKDVFKTEVYALARYRNSMGPAIPDNVLSKPPSAELRPDQKDTDSLPPYEVLDPILKGYVEDDLGVRDLVARGHDRAIVEKVVTLVDRAEYKRRQAPPGLKVTTKAFGRDRRLPITNLWRGPTDAKPDRTSGPR
jgi:NAD+ synthase (glutamine-hydrolysing)